MAYREVGMVELREIMRRWRSGQGIRGIARATAVDRTTIADYVRAAVCEPLGLGLDPNGDPGSGMHASLSDVLGIGSMLLAPTILAGETVDEMTSVHFPGLSGVLPDYGRFEPLDWGLGVQRNTPTPTWMGSRTSSRSFGHFGGSGTFLWVDPELGAACAVLTDREFGEWAKEAWPRLSDAVVEALAD